MPWLLGWPGHQQPWYWLCKLGRALSYMRKISITCVMSMWRIVRNCEYMFIFLLKNLARKDRAIIHTCVCVFVCVCVCGGGGGGVVMTPSHITSPWYASRSAMHLRQRNPLIIPLGENPCCSISRNLVFALRFTQKLLVLYKLRMYFYLSIPSSTICSIECSTFNW